MSSLDPRTWFLYAPTACLSLLEICTFLLLCWVFYWAPSTIEVPFSLESVTPSLSYWLPLSWIPDKNLFLLQKTTKNSKDKKNIFWRVKAFMRITYRNVEELLWLEFKIIMINMLKAITKCSGQVGTLRK